MNDAPDTQPARDYRGTVFLPQTSFPMRGDLPKREPQWLARWEADAQWAKLRAAAKGRPPFVLHDGPPYANGPLHIGHALNKILKDVINRAAQMAGFDADYIPGWDCHGLPIEWKVEEEYRAKKKNKDEVPVLEFRAECRAYAQKWLDFQTEEFKRLGVAGDFAQRYATMDFPSEAVIAGEIGRFLLNGSLYRGLRPVMWSPVEKTALAEAEIEYADHVSPMLWARFRVAEGALAGANLVAWTTTPWTIPANRALAVNPELDYALVHVNGDEGLFQAGERLVVSMKLLPDFTAATGLGAHDVVRLLKGEELVGLQCRHPFAGQFPESDLYETPRPVLAGDFVTDEAGTGIVHMAPDHGEDDFNLCRAHGIPAIESLNDDGTYAEKMTGVAGLHVFKAHDRVWELCEAAGTLVAKGKLSHSYPHSWRSKKPVIFRATPQWFIAMDDANAIRTKAMDAIAATRFIPEVGRNRIGAMVSNRPDWCISRQRAWGVPIAVFVEKRTGEVLRDETVMRRIVDAFRSEGADAWYQPDAAARFLGNERNPDDYEQVMDIVDVWFESGSTHAFVLEGRGMPWPADLYLEGSDQHRGWFQSSLLEAVGTRGVAPFKSVLTHGFVLDEGGRKMSKSLGNVTAPQEVISKYGADILRLWVMNSDTAEDLRIGKTILEQQAELYRRLRNSLRWILGGLAGFTEAERVPVGEMPELERWVLHRLSELDARVRGAVASHDWSGVVPEIHGYCATDLSAFWFDIRKDALYCDGADSLRRRAVRTVLDHLHRCLCAWLAPVLVFTAEEAWRARFGEEAESIHLQLFPEIPAEWRDEALAAKWARIRELRREVTGVIEAARASGQVGSSLQAAPTLALPEADRALLDEEGWAEVSITSGFTLEAGEAPAARFAAAPGSKCERCWRVLPEVSAAHGLCRRCEAVVQP
ncbi:isoleucine--tRNA ligase [Sabulicella rubraurantiaca]|uniref:isoleucine--tRNA ligase n=1 Tax=Sabulicella rubraurantiaca TaxID=2811429 RepID=UPI001A95BF34|nr:isoleucine--tRNA ligase [Sabulicella rubraurantiaca]